MERDQSTALALFGFRLGYTGLLIGFHGWSRFFRAWNFVIHGQAWTFVNVVERLGFPMPPAFAVISALSESIAAAMIALGLYTRWAALILSINMAVALYNEAVQWQTGGTPELPGLYLLGALVFLVAGGGPWSMDARRNLQIRDRARAPRRRR